MAGQITCTIIFPAEFQGGKNATWTLRYKIEVTGGTATDDQVKTALAEQSAETYGGLARDTYSAKEENQGLWLGEVRYVSVENQKREPQAVGTVRETFNTGGGTQHITQSKQTKVVYGTGDLPVANTEGAIGVDADGHVQGCDVDVPAYSFGRRKVFLPGDVTDEYKGILYSLTGKVNSGEFLGFAAGEVLFLGANGSDRDDGCYEIDFSFSSKPNMTGQTCGEMTDIEYGGHDYVWIRYKAKEDASAKDLVPRPCGVYVERVYDAGDFSALGDLAVTEPA